MSDPSPISRVVILPGNGCTPVYSSNWYAWLKDRLLAEGIVPTVELKDMPDPHIARETIWLPFIRDELKVGEDTVVVGHSSGAAMRLLQTDRLAGVVLVSACHTDLGDKNEQASGYYSRPWEWKKIKENAGFVVQFHSTDDPFIPAVEARHIHEKLASEYEEHTDKSHFFEPYEGIFNAVKDKVAKVAKVA